MIKRAVVVGVNDYSVQGFRTLSACVRDAQAMYHLLVDALGFDPSQVWLYTDARATSATIRQALSYMLAQSEPGDVGCFYFAGHGGLHPVTDETSYQTIIPYSGRFISDFDFFTAGEQLPPAQVNFTVILDSCHSGGMHEESEHPDGVRSIRFAREMIDRLVASMKTLVPCGVTVPSAETYRGNARSVRASGTGPLLCDEDPNQQFISQAKSTLLSACRWDETAGENAGHGYFTQAILDTVDRSDFAQDHRTFHQRLLNRTNEISGGTQTVQIRGQANRMEEGFLQAWRDSR